MPLICNALKTFKIEYDYKKNQTSTSPTNIIYQIKEIKQALQAKPQQTYRTPLTINWNHKAGTRPFCNAEIPSCLTIVNIAWGIFL